MREQEICYSCLSLTERRKNLYTLINWQHQPFSGHKSQVINAIKGPRNVTDIDISLAFAFFYSCVEKYFLNGNLIFKHAHKKLTFVTSMTVTFHDPLTAHVTRLKLLLLQQKGKLKKSG